MTESVTTQVSKEILDRVLTGGNHLGLIIGADHPLYTESYENARHHYGDLDRYNAWCCWKAIMELANAIRI